MAISQARADEVNAKMARVASELTSPYAKYPLSAQTGRSMWVNPSGGRTAKDELCFIAGQGKDEPMKKPDYVYGPGTMGYGYYHLLTRDSYKILYVRLQSAAPVACCSCFNKEATRAIDEHDEVTRICYNRSVATIPDDIQAAKDAEAKARGTAKVVYNYTQNEQLFLNGVQTAAFLAGG
mmetsp:Transcript_28013/g.44054  ORF Transcript_28013/g.44054 Transcript_28013/m.44054 type:complete len:180 (-) Transcript_28013:1213-1752(-)